MESSCETGRRSVGGLRVRKHQFLGGRVLFALATEEREPFRPLVKQALKSRAKVTVLNVVSTVLPADVTHLGLIMQRKRWIESARRNLRKFSSSSFGRSKPTLLVREGAPGPMIVQAARELHCDLVVMGTHGYLGFRHALLGSTAEYVARHAPCAVLIFRKRDGSSELR